MMNLEELNKLKEDVTHLGLDAVVNQQIIEIIEELIWYKSIEQAEVDPLFSMVGPAVKR